MHDQQRAAAARLANQRANMSLLMISRSLFPSLLSTTRPAICASLRTLRTVRSEDRAAASHTKTELIEDGLRYDPKDVNDFFDKVNHEIETELPRKRLFAIVYLYALQHLITEGDFIMIRKFFPAEVGARVKIERVLLVGSDNLTLVGRPVLDRDLVHVEATVIEKTLSHCYSDCRHVPRRSNYWRWRFNRFPLSFLRINKIRVCHKINESPREVQ